MQELPDNPDKLLVLAVKAYHKEDYKKLRRLCRRLLRSNRNDYFALCWYANSLYFLGKQNDHKAVSLYEQAIKVNPDHPLAHAGLGRIHHDNAISIAREYSIFPGGSQIMFEDELSPDDKSKRGLKGFADSECGNRKVAIKELEKAADLVKDRDDKVVTLSMAANIHCLISNEDGIQAYKKLLDIAPDYVQAHFDLAGCYAATGKCKLALQEYRYIKENAPKLATELKSVLTRYDIDVDD
ncbi:tetratricopeptide repeat protein [Acidobacteriota bacterium]